MRGKKPYKILIDEMRNRILIRSFENDIFCFELNKKYSKSVSKFNIEKSEHSIVFTKDRVIEEYENKAKDFFGAHNDNYERWLRIFSPYTSCLQTIIK